MQLKKGETIVAYLKRIVEVINRLESPGRNILELERKRILRIGLSIEFNFTAETIVDRKYSYYEAVPK